MDTRHLRTASSMLKLLCTEDEDILRSSHVTNDSKNDFTEFFRHYHKAHLFYIRNKIDTLIGIQKCIDDIDTIRHSAIELHHA